MHQSVPGMQSPAKAASAAIHSTSTADHIRFSEQPHVSRDEQNSSDDTSDTSSPDATGYSRVNGWSPRLLPHETGLSENTEEDQPRLRRSSSAPSLVVFEWKPSSAFDNEDEDPIPWGLEMNPKGKNEEHSQPLLPTQLKKSHSTDEVDPFNVAAPSKEQKQPEVEIGITWSSLRKINSKLVQWSFSGGKPNADRDGYNMLSEFSVSNTPPHQLEPSLAPSSHTGVPRFVADRDRPARPPTFRNHSAMKVPKSTSGVKPQPRRAETDDMDHLAVPCFRGLRDSIAIARSRSQPRKNKQAGGDKVNPALLDGTQERLLATKITEEVQEHEERPPVIANMHRTCCLSMTPLLGKTAHEPRQDSVANTNSRIPAPTKVPSWQT